jgi:hypothetical protein
MNGQSQQNHVRQKKHCLKTPIVDPRSFWTNALLMKLFLNFWYLQSDIEKVGYVNDWIFNNKYVLGTTDASTSAMTL